MGLLNADVSGLAIDAMLASELSPGADVGGEPHASAVALEADVTEFGGGGSPETAGVGVDAAAAAVRATSFSCETERWSL